MLINSYRRAYIVILLMVVLVTANSLKNSFIFVDDNYFIVNNPKIDISLREIPSLFVKPFGQIFDPLNYQYQERFVYYRPALSLFYSLNYKVWGINPVGFHLTNILFHLLSAIFVFRIGLLLFNNNMTISLIASALFAVHPVHNEVLGRVAMNENMFGFFIITTLYFFLSDKKYFSYLTFTLALLSKESAVMLPFVLCLMAINKDGLKNGITSMIPFALLLGIYSLVRTIVVGFLTVGNDFPFYIKHLNMVTALTDYLRLLVIPYPLSPLYPSRLYTSLMQPHVLASLGGFFLMGYFVVFKIRKDKVLFNLLISIIIMLIPVIIIANTLILGFDAIYIAERQLYVPAMFFSLFLSGLILKDTKEGVRKCAVTGLTVVIILFSVILISTCKIWENDSTISAKLIKDSPDINVSHSLHGENLYNQGKLDEAMHEFKAAFNPNSNFYNIVKQFNKTSNLKMYIDKKEVNPSKLEVMREYNPAFAPLHFNIGRIYLEKNDLYNATKKFKVAVILQPHFVEARYYLAKAYLKSGEFDKAQREFKIIRSDMNNNRIYRR